MKTKFDLTQFEDNSPSTTCTVSVTGCLFGHYVLIAFEPLCLAKVLGRRKNCLLSIHVCMRDLSDISRL